MEQDIRTLCYKCATEMELAGYWLFNHGNSNRSECDKCNRQGSNFEVKK